MLPINKNDTGLTVTTMSVEAWRADGTELDQGSLGVPTVFTGNDYLLLGCRSTRLRHGTATTSRAAAVR